MTPEERSEALIESIQDGDQDQLVESWMAEVRADERRRTAELIIARLEENERWLNDEIVTDDGFAQQVGRSVLADMRSLAREIGGGDE